MDAPSFVSWVDQRKNRPDKHISQADKIVPLLQQAGPAGMTRRQLGGAIDLSPELVDALLAALLGVGQIKIVYNNGVPIYRV
jgi:hypothetical protein